MTTVVDPAGSPVPVYNRSGTTIVDLTAIGTIASGPSAAAVITSYSTTTVVLVTIPDDSNYAVMMPSGAEAGDTVEIYIKSNSAMFTSQIWVWFPSGDTVNLGVSGTNSYQGQNLIFRKASSTAWYATGA